MARDVNRSESVGGEPDDLCRAADRVGWIASGAAMRERSGWPVEASRAKDAHEVANLLLALGADLVDAALERRLGPVAVPAVGEGVALGDCFRLVDALGVRVDGPYEVTERSYYRPFVARLVGEGSIWPGGWVSVTDLLDATACPGWRRVEARTTGPTPEQMTEAVEHTRGWMAAQARTAYSRAAESAAMEGFARVPRADLDGLLADVDKLLAAARDVVRVRDRSGDDVEIDAVISALATRTNLLVPSRLRGVQ